MAAGGDMQQQLGDLQRDLWRSAEIGKTLLAENEELHAALESMRKEHASQLEALVQEKHELNMKLGNATRMEVAYREEIESLRDMLVSQRALAEQDVSARHAEQILLLQQKLGEASSRIKDLEASEQATADERAVLDARLEALLEQKRRESVGDRGRTDIGPSSADGSMAGSCRDSDETNIELGLQEQLDHALQCQARLQEELEKAVAGIAAAEALTRRHAEQCTALRADVEDAQSQANSFSFALEKQRQENQDLRAELDMMRLLSQDHKTKGNSLFAELEDKRLEAEKRIVSLLVENKSLAAQSDQYNRQLRTLKVQLANVLRETSSSVDAAHVEQLERRLADAMARNEELVLAVQRFESEEAHQARLRLTQAAAVTATSAASSVATGTAASTASGTGRNEPIKPASYVDISYTQALLKSKDSQLEKLRAELQAKRYELLAESSRLQESDRRLRDLDGLVAKLRAENVQLCVRLEDSATARPSSAVAVAPASNIGSDTSVASATTATRPSSLASRDLAPAEDGVRVTWTTKADPSVAQHQLASVRPYSRADVIVPPDVSRSLLTSSVQHADSVACVKESGVAAATCVGSANVPAAPLPTPAEPVSVSLPQSADCSSYNRRGSSELSLQPTSKPKVAASNDCLAAQRPGESMYSRSLANPRTAARLAKMEASLRDRGDGNRSSVALSDPLPVAQLQPKLTARSSACSGSSSSAGASSLLPKLTARASASSDAAAVSLSTLDDSPNRHSPLALHLAATSTVVDVDVKDIQKKKSCARRAQGVMKEVLTNVPVTEDSTRSQQTKLQEQGQREAITRHAGSHSVPTSSDVVSEQENCPVQ